MVYRKEDGSPATTSDLDFAPKALSVNSTNIPVRRAIPVSTPAVITGPATLPITEGFATNFGSPSDLVSYRAVKDAALAAGKTEQQAEKAGLLAGDNGIGAPRLGAVSSTSSYGVALPESYLRQHLGDNPVDWRTARANVTINNQSAQVPIIDLGPGDKPQAKGVVTDVSYPLSQAFGGFDMTKAKVGLVANAGPDYVTNRDAWDREQSSIASNFSTPQIGAEPAPTPSQPAPADYTASLAGNEKKLASLGLMN